MTVHNHGERPYGWVGALSERRAQLSPDRIGLVDADTGDEYTYAELDERANRTARLLREHGVEKGDRIAVVSRNRPELVDLYFATAKVGAILAPLSYRLAPREITEMLNDVEPAMLFVEKPFEADVDTALRRFDREFAVPPVIGLPSEEQGDFREHSAPEGREWERLPDVLPNEGAAVERADLALSDPHLFLHTGGSTGLPKEVVQTHGGIMWNAFNTIISWGLQPHDVTPMVFPMFHTGGWNVLTIPFFHMGGTVLISRDFDPRQVLDLIEAYQCSVLVAVPAVLRFMVEDEQWENTDLSSLRFAKSGGGPCRDSIIEAWSNRGIDLSQGYGLTECGPNNFAMPDNFEREKTASIGMPSLYVDARIVDENGEELPQGEVGELELASPHSGDRYWNNEAETEEVFGGSSASGASGTSEEGTASGSWVSTGDLARVDHDGYYHIEGRKKNLFVSGGENVFPPEVEDVIAGHPKVEDVIVVPVPDEKWGEVGKAVVEGEESLTLDELQEYLDDRIAAFKVPKHLAFVDEMPMSGPSKIDRQALEEEYGGGAHE
ncbi:class I adenylate-forming enzyme family protein [Salinibaculum salinum]|uniref:class I adenylate-forming enzyme family protein n=1 Tax=Salinibaculum salinum TaxID=3131996 RepID=UPI0030EE3F4E